MKNVKQFATFVVVGGAATAIQYAVLIAWVRFGAGNAATGSVAGYVLSAIFSYLGNYYLTFHSGKRHSEAMAKFAVVVGVGAAINFAIEYALADVLRMHYLLAQVIATGITMLINFFISRGWAFRRA